MSPPGDTTPEERLRDAEQKRDAARRTLERKASSLEALVQGRKRILAIVERLGEDEPSAAEEKLLATLKADAKDFGDRMDEARAERERQQEAVGKLGERIQKLRRRLKQGDVTMYDSIDVGQIPRDGEAAAGYTSGNWPTWQTIRAGPWPHKLSIAVTASHDDAECLDIEVGDATPDQAPAWVKRAKQRGVRKPVVYASLSTMQAVLAALSRAGIGRDDVRVWTAHYTGTQHICTPACGFGFQASADATQWTSESHGRNLDESLCDGSFF
jgi:3-oxoacyl-(acyl-carrier-protein) synthase